MIESPYGQDPADAATPDDEFIHGDEPGLLGDKSGGVHADESETIGALKPEADVPKPGDAPRSSEIGLYDIPGATPHGYLWSGSHSSISGQLDVPPYGGGFPRGLRQGGARRNPESPSAPARLSSWLQRHVAPLVLVLAVIVGGTYAYQIRQESRHSACQARFNAAFTKSLSLRSDASNARQDAVDGLLGGVSALIVNPPKTPAEEAANTEVFRKLFVTYIDANAHNAEVRAANPLPPIPDC